MTSITRVGSPWNTAAAAAIEAQEAAEAAQAAAEQVLEDIRYYLRQTDLSIKQICDKLAFPNPSFFGKYVKDHFGMTPLEFRNN